MGMLINIVCVGLALLVAKEKQFVPVGGKKGSVCDAITGMSGACKGMPAAFYILLFVQAMVWLGNTVWGGYGMEWFTLSVYPGDPEAARGSVAREMYVAGETDFGTAGQLGSIFNLCLSFLFMGLGFTSVPSHLIFAPCIFVGAGVCFLCAFVVGQSRSLAILAFVLSNVCLTAAGSLPYGIVAVWNKAAEQAGKAGSVAMQMAVLNCCITVGQQLCTMVLGGLEGTFEFVVAIKYLFIVSMMANGLAGVAALFLNTGKAHKAVSKKGGLEAASSADTLGTESEDCTESD